MALTGLSRTTVTSFFATEVTTAAKNLGRKPPDHEQLAQSINEIDLETQTNGACFIKVYIDDPLFSLVRSGFLNRDEETEELPRVVVEFPEESNWFWRLVNVELTNDLTQSNVILTFEDRQIAQLREQYGYKTVPAGTQTRAQFIRSMVIERNATLPRDQQLQFVCPQLNVIQETEATTSEKKEHLTGKNELGQKVLAKKHLHDEHIKINREPGVSKGTTATVKGQTLNDEQRQTVDILLKTAAEQKAPVLAVEAMMFAAIVESDMGREGGTPNAGGYWGVFSGNVSVFPHAPKETKKMSECFLNGGLGFLSGGAIQASRTMPNPIGIAVAVEGVATGPNPTTENQYVAEGNLVGFLNEARALINEGGGIAGSGRYGGSGSSAGTSDVGQLTRGTTDDPYEDSWTCMQRLAAQVRWSIFGTGLDVTTFTRGRYLYYMDAYDFIRQKPAAHLDISANRIRNGRTGKMTAGVITEGMTGNFDNTAFEHQSQVKVHQKIAHRAGLSKPTTPAEIRIPLICEPLEYQAGDVFLIENSGPFNGRWIVSDAIREWIMQPFTRLTLVPPLLPYPEPSASAAGTAGTTITGLQAVVEKAQQAFTEKSKYEYSEGSDRENHGTLFGSWTPRTMDCSSFATLCYKEANEPDPSAVNYAHIGNTTSMIAHMVATNRPVPGDLVFYGSNAKEPNHVVVYIGNGQAIGMEDKALGIAQGPAWGHGNLGEGAGPPVGGEGTAWRLRGEYGSEVKHGKHG